MIDATKVDPRLAAQFIGRARRAAAAGYAVGSTSEQIVTAFLNGRSDWLPAPFQHPLEAISRLYAGGPEWFHTMMAVSKRDWRAGVEMHEDRLP